MPKKFPLVSVVVVNYNGKKYLKDCFDSLFDLNYPKDKIEIIMVDNLSSDGSIKYVKENYPKIKVIKNDVNNYCRANNLGIKKSKGEFVALLNNDTKVDKNWLIELVKVISKDNSVGAVGSKILLMDGRISSVGHIECPHYNWGDKGFLEEDKGQYDRIRDVQSISNTSALYRRKVLDEIGMLDEDFNMYMEDVDIAFRMRRKKWKILFVPNSVVYHELHGSQQTEEMRQFCLLRNRLLFISKHFPEKLPESICGFGEITQLSYTDFQKILISVFNKLVRHQGLNKAMKIMSGLQKSIEILEGYRQHCFKIELEKRTVDIQQQVFFKTEQIKVQQELIKTKEEQLHTQSTELKVKEEQNKAQQEVIKDREKQLSSQDETIRSQDEQLQTQQELIKTKEEQLHTQVTELKVREEQDKAQQETIKDREKQITSQDETIQSQAEQLQAQQELIKAKEEQIHTQVTELKVREEQDKAQQETIKDREKQITSQDETIRSQDEQLQTQQELIKTKEEQLHTQSTELKVKEEQNKAQQEIVKAREEIIAQKTNEIFAIYNSETYRIFVRPILWPIFSFVKKINNLFKVILNKKFFLYGSPKNKKPNICIAQLSAKDATARYMQENEYIIKIVNNNFEKAKVKLIVDICPYCNPYHPQRHFAYFAIEIVTEAKDFTLVRMVYNWEEFPSFFIKNDKRPLIDSWRGDMRSYELYIVKAYIHNLEGSIVDDKVIAQRLRY